MLKHSSVLAAFLVSMGLLTGCGSSSSSSDAPVVKGVVVDGIIKDAEVCVDSNGDGDCSDEPASCRATTDVFGEFDLGGCGSVAPLVSYGGTDTGTGLAFTGSLKAPAGSLVVTPMTSATQALVEGGQSAEEAEATIKAAFGIDEAVELTEFNPFKALDEGTPAEKEQAQQVLAQQAKVQTIVHSISAAVAGADE
ncbi:MAG: hypothetical protein U9R50_02865, partial [Campylobacterota bacterium]|nr:hypothetical protein [Campylobacterota bacterium]